MHILYLILAPSSLTLLLTYSFKISPSDNRRIQINMLVLVRAKLLKKVIKCAILYNLFSLTLKTNAISKKRASSREDALYASAGTKKALLRTIKSAISSPLRLKVA